MQLNQNLETGASGEVHQHMEYFPFGETFFEEAHGNDKNTPYKFNGKELDEETGLYYYGARYYDPRISMWYGVDKLADKHPEFSAFAFTANNPIILVDIDGNDWILVTGDKAHWYGGDFGDKSNLQQTFKATSGMDIVLLKSGQTVNLQRAKYQTIKDAGPTAEGTYKISLKPSPDRVAKASTKTGQLYRSPEGGIEKIPDFVESESNPGMGWTYEAWGKNRARLESIEVTGATSKQRDNNSYYLHDSEKGYTHGCTEVETELFKKLREYREAGNEQIKVQVKYPNTNHITNGGTKKIEE